MWILFRIKIFTNQKDGRPKSLERRARKLYFNNKILPIYSGFYVFMWPFLEHSNIRNTFFQVHSHYENKEYEFSEEYIATKTSPLNMHL